MWRIRNQGIILNYEESTPLYFYHHQYEMTLPPTQILSAMELSLQVYIFAYKIYIVMCY